MENPKKSYAPYKYEIEMLRAGKFDPDMKERIVKEHEKSVSPFSFFSDMDGDSPSIKTSAYALFAQRIPQNISKIATNAHRSSKQIFNLTANRFMIKPPIPINLGWKPSI